MHDIYEAISKSVDEAISGDTVYKHEVDVHIDFPNRSGPAGPIVLTTSPKTTVAYELDVDARSWGIKEMQVIPRGTAKFTFINPIGVSEDITVEVDLEKASVDYIDGSGIAPVSLYVQLDKAYNPVKVRLDMYFIKK